MPAGSEGSMMFVRRIGWQLVVAALILAVPVQSLAADKKNRATTQRQINSTPVVPQTFSILVASTGALSVNSVDEFEEPIQLTIDFVSIQKATELEQAGDAQGALETLLAAVESSPDDATLITALGAVYLQMGQVEEARAEFERAVAVNNDDPSGHAGLCYVGALVSDSSAVAAQCETARNRNISDPVYMKIMMSAELLQNGIHDSTVGMLDGLVMSNPYVPALRLLSLEANLRAERPDGGRQDLIMLEQIYRPGGKPPRILDRIASFKLADVVGTDIPCFLDYAQWQIAALDGAVMPIETIERLSSCRGGDDLAYDKALVERHNEEGMAARTRGDLATAIEEFNQALALEPDNLVVLANLSYAAFESKDMELAAKTLGHILELTPDDPEARRNYGILLLALGKEDEAKEYLGEPSK